MPRLLIVYGTTDGQTAKIAQFLAQEFRALGAEIELFDAAVGSPGPDGYDGVIVAASVHAGGFQRSVQRWVTQNREALHCAHAVFLPVSLSVLQENPRVARDLAAVITRFKRRTGWIPAETKLVAGAVLYTRYGWLKQRVMRYMMRQAGGGTDTSRDFEYTDWADLEAFARDFYASCGGSLAVINHAVGMTTCDI
jgi:menaquinone-dependent protoporphyrinogen oxidase